MQLLACQKAAGIAAVPNCWEALTLVSVRSQKLHLQRADTLVLRKTEQRQQRAQCAEDGPNHEHAANFDTPKEHEYSEPGAQ